MVIELLLGALVAFTGYEAYRNRTKIEATAKATVKNDLSSLETRVFAVIASARKEAANLVADLKAELKKV